jgi:hypothetical protein
LREVFEWLEDYRRFWDRSLDSLAEHLRVLQLQNTGKKRDRSKRTRHASIIKEGNKE